MEIQFWWPGRPLAGVPSYSSDDTARPNVRRRAGLTIGRHGQPGLIAQQNGTTVTVLAFGITGDHITRIWAVRNPDKLRPRTTG